MLSNPISSSAQQPVSPDISFGVLFEQVQMQRVFPDSKTFADCTPKLPIEVILAGYAAQKNGAKFNLKDFVLEHFDLPVTRISGFTTDPAQSTAQHIHALWPVLTRQPDPSVGGSTLFSLPKSYIVSSGQSGEINYWDSYFTMLGLASEKRQDLIQNMVDNYGYLIDTYGHIPSANRACYGSRSQPPFFSLMVKLAGKEQELLPQLEKEYQFWMQGADQVGSVVPALHRVVWLDQETILNRYADDQPVPRPEAYREDVAAAATAFAADRPKADTYLNIRAAAESGWDFSSRWGVGKDLQGINTLSIVPVDLNCLIWHLEQMLSAGYQKKGDADKTEFYAKRAYLRERAIRKYCWNATENWFEDFDWSNRAQTGIVSAAGMYPLFFKIAEEKQAALAAQSLKNKLLRPGGVVSTTNTTGQVWDAPYGYAPMQWISIVGLRNYAQKDLANQIKSRWISLCTTVYNRTGKMLEKYNVEDLAIPSGGGTYPDQDGYGWTNGVLLQLLTER